MLTWLKKTIWFAVFLGMIGLVNVLLPKMLKPTPLAKGGEHQLEEYMLDAQAVRFDKDGTPRERLNIGGIYHYQAQDYVILKEPKLILDRDDAQWVVTAKSGKSYHPKDQPFERLDLEDDVRISLNQQTPEDWHLETTHLMVYPKLQVAKTDSDVTIFSNHLTIQGTGMHSDFKLGRVDLLNQVKTTYETNS